MVYVLFTALVIYVSDVFLTSWKAIAIGAVAFMTLFLYEHARELIGERVPARIDRRR